jgi:hypothetical protein
MRCSRVCRKMLTRALMSPVVGFLRESSRACNLAHVRLVRYLQNLSTGRMVLWCYLIWWVVSITHHFDPSPRIWLTSLGLSGIIGLALILSTRSSSSAGTKMDPWVVFRLFLMPFCVSSFAALVKDAGYILVFPPSLWENVTGGALIAAFLLIVRMVKARR